jgi:hypothetical protein
MVIARLSFRTRLIVVGLGILLIALAWLGRAAMLGVRAAESDDRSPVVAVPGYHISLFTSLARTNAHLAVPVANPDSLAVDGHHVFIDYQNSTSKTGGDGKSSTVVEYSMDGDVLHSWSVSGHSDGMRIDPSTHLIWTTSNEDGNPTFALIDPVANTVTPYTFPSPTPHGGGYDDLYFLDGKVYVAASNPSGSTFPAVDQIVLNADHSITLTPILYDNSQAKDVVSGNPVTLALTDPDSLSTDGNGDLVLVSQGDSLIITIANPGAGTQSVTSLTVGTQLDDTVYPNGSGRLLMADAGGNTYWVSKETPFAAGSIYTQAPNDSTVINFLGTVNAATGTITPFAVGFTKPTGMIFVPGPLEEAD